jgi:hypothetical protein
MFYFALGVAEKSQPSLSKAVSVVCVRAAMGVGIHAEYTENSRC